MAKAFLKEIFDSIQGEALYIGQKQLFIRFCGCNLNCSYCDTNFEKDANFIVHDLNKTFHNPVNSNELKEIVDNFSTQTISLTGGEPLLYADFLSEFLTLLKNKKIYLETNGTLVEELEKVISFVDVVSMDIKLFCSTMQKNEFEKNRKFIEVAKKFEKEIFVKIVLDKNYSKTELLEAINLVKEFDIPLIIQPMDCKDKTNKLDKNSIIELFDFINIHYKNTRFIPQMHKYLKLL